MASRRRKGSWRMSPNRIVQQAMTNRWLEERGVPNIRTLWINVALAPLAPPGCRAAGGLARLGSLRAKSPCLIGTAGCGPACPVVWDPWLTNTQSRGPD